MKGPTDQERRELVRKAVLTFAAEGRQALAHDAATISRRINAQRDFDFSVTAEEVTEAGKFLAGLNPPLLTAKPINFGSTLQFQATSAGVLAFERGDF